MPAIVLAALYFAFIYAPTEAVQGDVQRIFYFHVSFAWLAYLAFFLVFLGSIIYPEYRLSVRETLHDYRLYVPEGAFELKEHLISICLGLLPAYWYFGREPGAEHAGIRRWITVFLALSVWYAFVVCHVANDFRGVGS